VSFPCGYTKCRRKVDFGEGILENGIWYHERCYYQMLSMECDKLEKKARAKTMTIDEYERYEDIKPLVNRIYEEIKKPPQPTINDIIGCSDHPTFEGKSAGMKLLENSRDNDIEYIRLKEGTTHKRLLE